jgi:FkbM family methyltransferase
MTYGTLAMWQLVLLPILVERAKAESCLKNTPDVSVEVEERGAALLQVRARKAKNFCPAECNVQFCLAGSISNGGVELVGGICTSSCSRPFNGLRFCGVGPNYEDGQHVDCSSCYQGSDQASSPTVNLQQDQVSLVAGTARSLLPVELFDLGLQLFGSEQLLDGFISNTRVEYITYAGIPLVLRMVVGDLSNYTLWGESGSNLYGLDNLKQVSPKSRWLNMVDLGGNYGAVSIAAYKNNPAQLRGVAVEPIPSTYLLLRWNMKLNGVPALEEAELQAGKRSGLLAINRALTNKDNDPVALCYTPPMPMNALFCDCDQRPPRPGEQCLHVEGVTTQTLVNFFGPEPIAMMKVDCEGCEVDSLPALGMIAKERPGSLLRVAGELHMPHRDLEDIACQFDGGRFFTRLCPAPDAMPLDCGKNPKPCKGEMPAVFLNKVANDR